jgi:hypothetical protein
LAVLYVFLALIEVILTAALANSNNIRMARNIDLLSCKAFPVVFLSLLGWFLFVE